MVLATNLGFGVDDVLGGPAVDDAVEAVFSGTLAAALLEASLA